MQHAHRRNPFEFVALAGAGLVGYLAIFGLAWPSEIGEHIPTWFNCAWGSLFVLGATLSLAGGSLKNRTNGIILEQIGLSALAATCYVCAGCIALLAGGPLFMTSFLFGALGIACTIQWFRLQSIIKSVIDRGRRVSEK